jgi:hypothetical protein
VNLQRPVRSTFALPSGTLPRRFAMIRIWDCRAPATK